MNNNIKELISLIPKLSLRYFIENMSLPGLIHSSSDIDPYLDYEFVKIKKKHIAVSLNCSSILDSKNSIESGERIPLFLWEATRALMNNIDREIIAAAVAGIGNIYGTGSTPSAMSDVTGTALKLNNTMCPIDGRHFVISPQVYANFSNVQGIIEHKRHVDGIPGVGRSLGFTIHMNPNLSNVFMPDKVKVEGLAFHRDCMAIVWPDFDPIVPDTGVIVYDEMDPQSGVRIRVTHKNSENVIDLQIAYLVAVMRPEFGALLVTKVD